MRKTENKYIQKEITAYIIQQIKQKKIRKGVQGKFSGSDTVAKTSHLKMCQESQHLKNKTKQNTKTEVKG